MISAMYSVARGLTCGSAAIERFQVVEERGFKFAGELAQGGFVFADALDDLVLDVRDVHDVLHVVAGKFERAADEVGEDERAPVADVREVIDGRAAAIHADFFAGGIERREFLDGAGQRVEQFQGHWQRAS